MCYIFRLHLAVKLIFDELIFTEDFSAVGKISPIVEKLNNIPYNFFDANNILKEIEKATNPTDKKNIYARAQKVAKNIEDTCKKIKSQISSLNQKIKSLEIIVHTQAVIPLIDSLSMLLLYEIEQGLKPLQSPDLKGKSASKNGSAYTIFKLTAQDHNTTQPCPNAALIDECVY